VHIAFWASGDDGSSWYRCDQPALALNWLGHRTWSSQVLPPTQQARADVVIGSRIARPGSVETWRGLKACGKHLVLDMDDDYFHIDPAHRRAHEFWSDPEIRDGLTEAIRLSDRCTCASEAQAEVLREYHDDVVVVPNGLHAWMLSAPRDYRPDRPVIGWAGTESTVDGLPIALSAIRRTAGRYSRPPRVMTVGVSQRLVVAAGLAHDHRPSGVEIEEWKTPGREYLSFVGQFDVWLAPYRDTPFNAAKFPTKALEAAVLGIPLIASDIRPYREWIAHGVNGLLAGSPDQWWGCLRTLLDDPGLRERMGLAARAKASRYTLQEVGRKWEAACTF